MPLKQALSRAPQGTTIVATFAIMVYLAFVKTNWRV